MTPEGLVKRRVRLILDRHEVYYFFPPANGYGRTGIPDVICCVNGYFIGIECKAGKNTPTALQSREIDRIVASNGVAMVVNEENLDVLEDLIRHVKERKG